MLVYQRVIDVEVLQYWWCCRISWYWMMELGPLLSWPIGDCQPNTKYSYRSLRSTNPFCSLIDMYVCIQLYTYIYICKVFFFFHEGDVSNHWIFSGQDLPWVSKKRWLSVKLLGKRPNRMSMAQDFDTAESLWLRSQHAFGSYGWPLMKLWSMCRGVVV